MIKKSIHNSGICLLLCALFLPVAQAGTLSDFEQDAEKSADKDSGQSHRNRNSNSHHHSDDDASLSYFMFEMFSFPFRIGGYYSMLRIGAADTIWIDREVAISIDEKERHRYLRVNGESITPYARFDLFAHVADGDVYSGNGRWEVGYGAMGLEWRYSDLRERNSNDRIEILAFNFLYRMAFGNKLGIDLGIGSMEFRGMSRFNGLSFTTPILYHHNRNLGIEWRPTWYKGDVKFNDYILNLHLGWKYVSFTAGYRWLSSDNVSLEGPVTGLVLKW